MKVKEKLQLLREAMKNENVQACIIPSTDPHIGEYTPERWKTREWISGFTGSAGTIVVTNKEAGLWTDSRYFIQAEEQLKESEIKLFKTGLPGTSSPEEWIKDQLSANETVGFEGIFHFNTEKPDGTMRKLTDVEKIHRLGWHHEIEIEEGVGRLFQWYCK